MPAKSQAQRGYLNAHFGHEWTVKHGFDNTGKLPGHYHKPAKASKAKAKSDMVKIAKGLRA